MEHLCEQQSWDGRHFEHERVLSVEHSIIQHLIVRQSYAQTLVELLGLECRHARMTLVDGLAFAALSNHVCLLHDESARGWRVDESHVTKHDHLALALGLVQQIHAAPTLLGSGLLRSVAVSRTL